MSSEWRPIAEAPKDGTRILLGGCKSGPSVRIGQWGNGAYLGSKQGYAKDWTTGAQWDLDPTNWQPLPEPPEQPQ